MSEEVFHIVDDWEFHMAPYNPSGFNIVHSCGGCLYQASKGNRWACIECFTPPPDEVLDVILLARRNGNKGREFIYEKPAAFYGIWPHECEGVGNWPHECEGFRLIRPRDTD